MGLLPDTRKLDEAHRDLKDVAGLLREQLAVTREILAAIQRIEHQERAQ